MYQFFKNIFLTKGFNRTLVYDSLTSKIHFFPNDLYDQLLLNNFRIDKKNNEVFEFLNKKGLLQKISDDLVDCFIDLDDEIQIPYDIATLVFELSGSSSKNLYKLKNQNILQYNFIFADYTSLKSIELFVDFINECESDTIELTFLNGFVYSKHLFELIKSVKKIILLNNFAGIKIDDPSTHKNRYLNSWNDIHFRLSINFINYLESLKHHTYFNKKVFINKDCEIKNSQETKEIYGNLNNDNSFDIAKVFKNPTFKKLWSIKKEDTLVCQDCEFRRLCVDNRLPIKIKNNWVHEEECNYNPYISKWSHEDGFKSLKELDIITKNGYLEMNKEKLSLITNELWEG
ncbi:hypothetical protein GOQ30_00705 [Flavobacterium sp. TP390]|uniref:Grasp-with-spasm system SPASM domain peptide maturase n=1 Tax=Flavobacterium profundi TaxID=1774945 RepID=A0A6I4IDN4_9FLAO|nr:hypothetical protein [Flavobacterium profundi]MVO07678.1 hypothetical protein [Flavobacterium profundi]